LHFAIKTDFSAAVCLSVGLLQSDRSCKQQPASWYAAEAAAAAAMAVAVAAAATATVTIALLWLTRKGERPVGGGKQDLFKL
jgi:hypothetical protein